MGAVFRIEDIFEKSKYLWIVKCLKGTFTTRRIRSFDKYRLTKRDYRRLNWSDSFRIKTDRYFEHPAFCKET